MSVARPLLGGAADGRLTSVARHVRQARAVLAGDDIDAGVVLLRAAERVAGRGTGETGGDVVTFRTLLDVRNELGGCLLAAERLEEAGVASRVVAGVLQRGAATAERILVPLVGALDPG